ncbi:hypothetical protein BU26DRAFT_505414 [Trematosphaeria pertusa]|uniref:Uncharacterized protein n=1 Tax=Trematosphaeria pertusa TaxID=390896 RepID=A0A6A6III7_9PLEO|nr:uncharacterized protein BU26DRAFT_505414 [Trematosphaeria pertusa]KAF2249373.1 hypothetical protein BU26DRAFT_505414 [Trematosphaeria pertusa]
MPARNHSTTSGVPPAPVLKFPSDLKKASSPKEKKSRTTKPPASLTTDNMTGEMENFIFAIEDFRDLDREKRKQLLEGPTVQVTCAGQHIDDVPLRLLLAASSVARIRYLNTGSIPRIGLADKNLKDAMLLLFGWMKDTCTKLKSYWLSKQTNFVSDVNLIVAAQQLGMDLYVKHIVANWWAALKNDPPEFPKLLAIERAAPNAEFTFFRCAVNRLAHMQLYGQISNEEEYQRWMTRLPKIAAAIKPVYERLEEDRRRRREEDAARREEEAKRMAEDAEIHRLWEEQRAMARAEKEQVDAEKARIAQEKQREQDMRDAVARNSHRVRTLTAEEARFVPRGRNGMWR